MNHYLYKSLLTDLDNSRPYEDRVIHHQLLALACAAKDQKLSFAYDILSAVFSRYGRRFPEDTRYAVADIFNLGTSDPGKLAEAFIKNSKSVIGCLNMKEAGDNTNDDLLSYYGKVFRDRAEIHIVEHPRIKRIRERLGIDKM